MTRRSGWLAALASVSVAASSADLVALTLQSEPALDSVTREYTVGMAEPVSESTYDVHPQIQVEPDTPYLKIVPIRKRGDVIDDLGPRIEMKELIKGGANFDGIANTGWTPPDPDIATGPNHIVEIVNSTVAFYDKNGNLQFSQALGSQGSPGFFEGVGAGSFVFDPKCMYDDLSSRFIIIALEVYSTTAYIDIAMSDDSDPNGTWHKYRTNAVTNISGNNYWVDYPGLTTDSEAVYVCGNLFPLSGGGFGGIKFRAFNKSNLMNGAAVSFADLRDAFGFSAQGAQPHTAPAGGLFVSAPDGSNLEVFGITNPLGAPVLNSANVNVTNYSSPPSAPNLGGSNLDTLDGRIINADFRNGSVATGHAIDGGGRAVSRWYELNFGNWPNSGTVTVVQEGELDHGAGIYSFFPALAINANSHIAIVAARSSASEFASIVYARNTPTDPAGSLQGLTTLHTGTSGYSGFRWGDYFDCNVDPNGIDFWGVGEYASGGSWRTRIGCLDFGGSVTFLFSTKQTFKGALNAEDGDVVSYDASTGATLRHIDISDVIADNVDLVALAELPDGSYLMSFLADENIPGMIGGPNGDLLADEDLVRFIPTTLGENTSGTFEFYFDGSDVGLTGGKDDLDAVSVQADGNLQISMRGPWDLGGGFTGKDEDILLFTVGTLGSNTTGTWSMLIDGSDGDVKLAKKSEDVIAHDLHQSTGEMTWSTNGDWNVPNLSGGDSNDLFIFLPTAFGQDPATDGSFLGFYFDVGGLDPEANVDALHRTN